MSGVLRSFVVPCIARAMSIHTLSYPRQRHYYEDIPVCMFTPTHLHACICDYRVYDGHGGHLCSDFAADRLHRELLLQPNLMDNPVEVSVDAGVYTD